jgi:hypothetical protein
MSTAQSKAIDAIRKKLNCDYGLCGEHFVFDITAEKLAIAKQNARYRYQGKCTRCGTVLKLSATGMASLSAGFGKYKLIVHETKYGDLFEEKIN